MITNKCTFLGTIYELSDVRMTANGRKAIKLTLSVRTGKDAEGKSIYEYIPCRAYEAKAELIAKWFSKGKAIGLETHCHRYTAEIEGVNRTITEFIVDDMTFLPSDYAERERPVEQPKPAPAPAPTLNVTADDLPF